MLLCNYSAVLFNNEHINVYLYIIIINGLYNFLGTSIMFNEYHASYLVVSTDFPTYILHFKSIYIFKCYVLCKLLKHLTNCNLYLLQCLTWIANRVKDVWKNATYQFLESSQLLKVEDFTISRDVILSLLAWYVLLVKIESIVLLAY